MTLTGGLLLCLFSLSRACRSCFSRSPERERSRSSSYPASALVGPLLPDDIRTSAFSLLMGLLAAQALGTAAIGGLADLVGTAPAITFSALPAVIAGLFYPQQVLSDYGCRPADNSAAPSRRAPGQTSRTPARALTLGTCS